MERRAAGDVRVRDDEVDDGADLGFRRRIRSRTLLLELLPPARGKVAVEVERLLRPLDLERVAVVVDVAPLRQDPLERAADCGRLTANHQDSR
jgi:hypothetical protein